jgi:hypothetical protein
MTRAILLISFAISIVTLPWFVSCGIAILYLSEGGSAIVVGIGGLILDMISAVPIPHLFGFAYLYTVLFCMLALAALYLREQLFE